MTERGKPVAMLTPIPALWRALEEMRSKGLIRGGEGNPKDLLGIAVRLREGQSNPDVSGAVIEERDEWERER